MVVNVAQLASYSQAKQMLLASGTSIHPSTHPSIHPSTHPSTNLPHLFTVDHFKDDIKCHFTASMISGFITTVASMPVDIAKTRIQSMKMVEGRPEYKGTFVS